MAFKPRMTPTPGSTPSVQKKTGKSAGPRKSRPLKMPATGREQDTYEYSPEPFGGFSGSAKTKRPAARSPEKALNRPPTPGALHGKLTYIPPRKLAEPEGSYEYTPQSIANITKKAFRSATATKKPKKSPPNIPVPGGKAARKTWYEQKSGKNRQFQPTQAWNSPMRELTPEQVAGMEKRDWYAQLRKFGIDTSNEEED